MVATRTQVEPVAGSGRELVSSRLLDARRDLVFEAFTDPAHVARWWGPKGFANTFHEFDPRPGGVWRFVMHGPDGRDHPNKHIFVEVVRPERLVLVHVSEPQFELTVSLADEGGGTRLGWRMLFGSVEECNRAKAYAVEANQQNFDRLAAELKKMGGTAGSPPVAAKPKTSTDSHP